MKTDKKTLDYLEKSFCSYNTKKVSIVKGFGFYPSDQKAFPKGVGVAALHKGPLGYWLGRIHTTRDTVFDSQNIELLRVSALKLVETLSMNRGLQSL